MWEFHSRETIWSRNDPLYGDELPSWWWQVHLNKISFTTRFWEIGICHNDTWLLCLSASSFVLPSIHFLALFKHHRQHYYSPGLLAEHWFLSITQWGAASQDKGVCVATPSLSFPGHVIQGFMSAVMLKGIHKDHCIYFKHNIKSSQTKIPSLFFYPFCSIFHIRS